jgi:hypothetical protein
MKVSGQVHASAALSPVERDAGTHWIRGMGGLMEAVSGIEPRLSSSLPSLHTD